MGTTYGAFDDRIVHEARMRLHVRRCFDCGLFWASEWLPGGCPKCTSEQVVRLHQSLSKAANRIAGLKGALTKARRKAKGGA